MNKDYQQKGRYRIQVKSEQSTHRWSDFNRVRLQISIGAPYHEGEKLAALLSWADQRFEEVDLHVNDTLQRHDLMFDLGVSEARARAMAASEGREWIDRHGPLIERVSGLTLRRWDYWLDHPLFAQTYDATASLYKTNADLRGAIDADVSAIWERRVRAGREGYTPDQAERFAQFSRKYLIEEVAAFAVMAETRPSIDVYPGGTLNAETVFQGKTVDGAPSGLGRGFFCRVDFAKNKSATPMLRRVPCAMQAEGVRA